jgi:trimethylamine:corrinoid methyltransferase-like protein
VLNEADVRRLEAAVFETLADVGVRFPLERALDALERGGCRVDQASQVARMPEQIVRAPLLAARRVGALEDAEVEAREILASHAPDSLPSDVREELRRLVAAADADLAGVHH